MYYLFYCSRSNHPSPDYWNSPTHSDNNDDDPCPGSLLDSKDKKIGPSPRKNRIVVEQLEKNNQDLGWGHQSGQSSKGDNKFEVVDWTMDLYYYYYHDCCCCCLMKAPQKLKLPRIVVVVVLPEAEVEALMRTLTLALLLCRLVWDYRVDMDMKENIDQERVEQNNFHRTKENWTQDFEDQENSKITHRKR